ncbi:MAG: hypothetical protein V4773_20450, partial [Verrucomicrobiota bacterium]
QKALRHGKGRCGDAGGIPLYFRDNPGMTGVFWDQPKKNNAGAGGGCTDHTFSGRETPHSSTEGLPINLGVPHLRLLSSSTLPASLALYWHSFANVSLGLRPRSKNTLAPVCRFWEAVDLRQWVSAWLRVLTMTGPASRRIGTVAPAEPDLTPGGAGGTVSAKAPYSRELNHKTNVYRSR